MRAGGCAPPDGIRIAALKALASKEKVAPALGVVADRRAARSSGECVSPNFDQRDQIDRLERRDSTTVVLATPRY